MFSHSDILSVVTILESRSLGHAAELIGISQPALTKRLKLIEERLGASLFHRQVGGLTPTQLGVQFVEHGKQVLNAANDFTAYIDDVALGKAGALRVGLKPGFDLSLVRHSIIDFHTSYPETRLSVLVEATPRLAKSLKNSEIDVAIGAFGYVDENGIDLTASDDLEFEVLADLPLSIVFREGHPFQSLPVSELSHTLFEFPLIGPRGPKKIEAGFATASKRLGRIYYGPNIQTEDYSLIFDLLRRTDSWSALFEPSEELMEESRGLVFRNENSLLAPLSLCAIKRKHWIKSRQAENFLAILRAKLPKAQIA